MKFRSETLEIIDDQNKMLKKIQKSIDKLDKIKPHTETCSNENCVGENPICDHAIYMSAEIKKHNELIDSHREKYFSKYPEAREFANEKIVKE